MRRTSSTSPTSLVKTGEKVALKGGVVVVNLYTGLEQAPTIVLHDHRNKPYIYYGQDNLYPQRLVDLYENSAPHGSAVDTIAEFVAGEGVELEDGGEVDFEQLLDGQTVDYFIGKVAQDVATFNGFYLQPLWNAGGKVDKLHCVDFSTIRASKIAEGEKKVTSFWHSVDWALATGRTSFPGRFALYQPVEYGVFDPLTFKEWTSTGQILQVKQYSPNQKIYARPHYSGALRAIATDVAIDELHLANLENGMIGNTHVHVYEDLSDDDKRQAVERMINKKFTGRQRAGRVILTWSLEETKAPVLNKLNDTNTSEMFGELDERTIRKIVTAHRLPPVLAGLDVRAGLDGKAMAIRESLEYFQRTVIKPKQNMITTALNYVLQFTALKGSTVRIKPLQTLSLASLLDVKTVLTTAEQREILGFDPSVEVPVKAQPTPTP